MNFIRRHKTRCKKSANKITTHLQLQRIERRDECLLLPYSYRRVFFFFFQLFLFIIYMQLYIFYLTIRYRTYKRLSFDETTVTLTIYMIGNLYCIKSYCDAGYLGFNEIYFIRKFSDQFLLFICDRNIKCDLWENYLIFKIN